MGESRNQSGNSMESGNEWFANYKFLLSGEFDRTDLGNSLVVLPFLEVKNQKLFFLNHFASNVNLGFF